MAITVYFKKESKRRNSTLQFALNSAQQFSCVLKSATSVDRPTFLLSATSFDYNLAHWDGRYYFIENITSVRDGQWEVSCALDALATYKTEIGNATAFISYADNAPAINLLDTRLARRTTPYQTQLSVQGSNPIYDETGFYVLSVTGTAGTKIYALTEGQLNLLISRLNTWVNNIIDDIVTGNRMSYTYDFSTLENAIESFTKMSTQTGVLGNAYSNAPANIQSCIWVPFDYSTFTSGRPTSTIYLGAFSTNITAPELEITPKTITHKLDLNWTYNDWQQRYISELILYLPFVGVINVDTKPFINQSEIYIEHNANAVDGKVLYRILLGNGNTQPCIGTYTGNCAANFSIGVNQRASLGDILQSAASGVVKTVSAGIAGNFAGGGTGRTLSAIGAGVTSGYNTLNMGFTSSPTTIGNTAGSVWVGSDLRIRGLLSEYTIISDVNHPNKAVLGSPVMHSDVINNYSGYVQCSNTHVSVDARETVLETIDDFVNTGFFYE